MQSFVNYRIFISNSLNVTLGLIITAKIFYSDVSVCFISGKAA